MAAGNGQRRTFQYLATFTSCLNLFTSGLHNGWTSTSLKKLLGEDSDIPTTNDEGSWIAVALLFGSVCGSSISALILDRLGRKKIILLSAALYVISWMVLAFAPSVHMLIIARFLAGIPGGFSFCSIPAYITEIAEPQIRGLLGSYIIVSFTMGILTMNLVGSYLSIKVAALVVSVVPLSLLLTFTWMPDSPYHLLMKGQVQKAQQSLQIFRGTEDVDEELTRIKNAVYKQNENTGKFFDLFTKRTNRKSLYIMIIVRATGLVSGATAIMFYAQIIFNEFSNDISPVTSSTIYFTMQVIFAGTSSLTVDKFGRRPLMIASLIGIIISLVTEGCYLVLKNDGGVNISNLSFIPILALVLFVIMFNVGMQSIPVLLVGEIFATNVRAFAFSINDIFFSLGNVIISKVFQYTKDTYGLHVPFFLFAVSSALGLFFIVIFVPETKGKTLEEIQEKFRVKSVKSKSPESEIDDL